MNKTQYIAEDHEGCQSNFDTLADALNEANIGDNVFQCEMTLIGTVTKTIAKEKQIKKEKK